MSSAELALQKALVAALKADPVLAAALSGVFDTPPPGQAFPYLCFGPWTGGDWGHKSGAGREHRLSLSLWDDQPDSIRLRQLMDAAERAALAIPAALDGHRLVVMRLSRSLVIRDPLGPDQGVIELRAKTLEAG